MHGEYVNQGAIVCQHLGQYALESSSRCWQVEATWFSTISDLRTLRAHGGHHLTLLGSPASHVISGRLVESYFVMLSSIS